MSHPVVVDMSPSAIEARLATLSNLSPLDLRPLPSVDMSPGAIEARLDEWAELTTLCLELAASGLVSAGVPCERGP